MVRRRSRGFKVLSIVCFSFCFSCCVLWSNSDAPYYKVWFWTYCLSYGPSTWQDHAFRWLSRNGVHNGQNKVEVEHLLGRGELEQIIPTFIAVLTPEPYCWFNISMKERGYS